MGQIFKVVEGNPAVVAAAPEGCWVEVFVGERKVLFDLCKLELDVASPLTPRTNGFEPLPKLRQRDGITPLAVQLGEGVWWCSVSRHGVQHLVVKDDTLMIATRAQAYCALGAVDLLNEMGLEDAAIALSAGQFDLASVQVIAERERRALER